MSEEEYMKCSVVAYPREIRFLHINGSAINYCVDRHISDYVDRLQKENQELQKDNEKLHSYKLLYQILKSQKEELRDWLEEQIKFVSNIPTFTKEIELSHKEQILSYRYILDKIEELELEGFNNESRRDV